MSGQFSSTGVNEDRLKDYQLPAGSNVSCPSPLAPNPGQSISGQSISGQSVSEENASDERARSANIGTNADYPMSFGQNLEGVVFNFDAIHGEDK